MCQYMVGHASADLPCLFRVENKSRNSDMHIFQDVMCLFGNLSFKNRILSHILNNIQYPYHISGRGNRDGLECGASSNSAYR